VVTTSGRLTDYGALADLTRLSTNLHA
jgi:hypothetical protein